jgi:hypothetical protein
MTAEVSSRIELRSSTAAVRFDKSLDRFNHELSFRFDQDWIWLLESDLQDPEAPWPTDPPIQQLVVEPIGSTSYRDVALGVGMCGHGHWSLAAQWVQLQNPDNFALELDYACRQQPPVSFLGSTYKLIERTQSQVMPTDSKLTRMVKLDQTERSWNARFAMDKSQACYELRIEVIEGLLVWHAESLRIAIVPSGSFEKPSTLRWCYRIAWLSCQE